MQFIDHTKRHPVFRVLDLEGNVLDSQYEIGDKPTLSRILDLMITHREMDKVYLSLHRQGRITFYMTTLYEEAIGLAVGAGLKDNDLAVLQYREQGICLWRGYTPLEVLHAVKGTNKDYNLGRALVFHYAHNKRGIMPGSAPIGSKIPHAAGAGFTFRVEGLDRVAVSFFGEAAASQGDFHAGLNFASTLGSQTLFVCRNNLYGISTPVEDQYSGDGVAPRGLGYGIPSIKVDGCDPLALLYVVKNAREHIMACKGPVLMETISYRGGDHSTSDSAATYRTKEVMEKLDPYIKSIGDPILRLGKYMEKKGWLQNFPEYLKHREEETRKEALQAAQIVDATPFPDWKDMLSDVYQEKPWNIKEQQAELEAHLKKYPDVYPLDHFKAA
jgi:2-oxoisovalerate dehydrogenase E1 component alpha subunit